MLQVPVSAELFILLKTNTEQVTVELNMLLYLRKRLYHITDSIDLNDHLKRCSFAE